MKLLKLDQDKLFFLRSPIELRAITEPVNDVENQEQYWHSNQKESVSIDIVGATLILHWFL